MSEWKPIETAPQDGTPILLAGVGPMGCSVGWWEFGDEQWMVNAIPLAEDQTIAFDWNEKPAMFFCVYAIEEYMGVPTHWQPLPEPPQ